MNLEEVSGGYVSLTSAALDTSATAAKFKTTATLTYTADGVFKSKGATDNLVFSAGHTSLANSQGCLFAVWIDAGGTVTTTQGPIVSSADAAFPLPAAASGKTLVGLIKVSCSSSQTFVPGTNSMGTGNTASYINCSVMPGSAQ